MERTEMTREEEVVQTAPTGSSNPGGTRNGGSGNGERLARIEARLEHVATREDVSEVKVLIERKESTMLRWLLGLMVVAGISLLAGLTRTFI